MSNVLDNTIPFTALSKADALETISTLNGDAEDNWVYALKPHPFLSETFVVAATDEHGDSFTL